MMGPNHNQGDSVSEYTTEQFDRLPKWAQQEINRLTLRLREANKRLSAGPEDSNVFADPYSDNPTPLGRDALVKFVVGDGSGDVIIVRRAGNGIYVQGHKGIIMRAQASNTVHVQFDPDR